MRITRENYELFFIDYFDGTLSDGQITELENFLLINPDLGTELEGMGNIKLVGDEFAMADKDILRKIDTSATISEVNFDDYSIAYVEGDLDFEKTTAFESYLDSNPVHKKDLELYRKVFLTTQPSIVYEGKNKLKKAIPLAYRMYLYSALSAAAAIALLMIIFPIKDAPQNISGSLAEKTENVVSKTPEEELLKANAPFESQIAGSSNLQNQLAESLGLESQMAGSTKIIPEKKVPAETFSRQIPVEILAAGQTKEDYEVMGNNIPDDLLTNLIASANLNLPPANIPGARPDVIPGLAAQEETPVFASSPTEPDYLSLPDIALKYANDKILKRDEPGVDPSKITLWDVADASIKGINRISGSEMKLERETRNSGEIKSINIDIGFFGFSRSVR
jgi:hypothetical protein